MYFTIVIQLKYVSGWHSIKAFQFIMFYAVNFISAPIGIFKENIVHKFIIIQEWYKQLRGKVVSYIGW